MSIFGGTRNGAEINAEKRRNTVSADNPQFYIYFIFTIYANNMHKTRKPIKILAIDPGTRYLGVAVLENQELIYWAVRTIKNRSDDQEVVQEGRKIISDLISFYQPEIVVIEKPFFAQSKTSERLQVLSTGIKKLVKKKNLTFREYAPTTVRKHICKNGWATKKTTAKIIVSLYPELKINLTQDRAWKERYWSRMFDAVALGLCCLQNRK